MGYLQEHGKLQMLDIVIGQSITRSGKTDINYICHRAGIYHVDSLLLAFIMANR